MGKYFKSDSSAMNRIAMVKWKVRSDKKDELGQYPIQEKVFCKVWCSVVPQTGSLLNGREAETQISKTTHKVVIRYRADIKPEMWLDIGGEIYDILYILDPYLAHDRLELFCEVRNNGEISGV